MNIHTRASAISVGDDDQIARFASFPGFRLLREGFVVADVGIQDHIQVSAHRCATGGCNLCKQPPHLCLALMNVDLVRSRTGTGGRRYLEVGAQFTRQPCIEEIHVDAIGVVPTQHGCKGLYGLHGLFP